MSVVVGPDREKAFTATKGGHDVKAKAVAEDDSDDNKGASIGHPRRKTRAIKGGRSAVVMTGWPKAGQDPDDPAATGSPKRDLCVCVLTCPPGW